MTFPGRQSLVVTCLLGGILGLIVWNADGPARHAPGSLDDAPAVLPRSDDIGAVDRVERTPFPSTVIPRRSSPAAPQLFENAADKGIALCDHWIGYYETPQGKLLGGASFGRVSLEEAERNPEFNPKRSELSEAERLALAFAMRPFDEAMTRASLDVHRSQWQAIRDKVLAGDFVVASHATSADKLQEVQTRATAEFERRTGIQTGLRVMMTGVPDVVDGHSRIIALVRGESHGHIEAWDAVERASEARTAAIKDWFANLSRDR